MFLASVSRTVGWLHFQYFTEILLDFLQFYFANQKFGCFAKKTNLIEACMG
jgi:hypothetical protein